VLATEDDDDQAVYEEDEFESVEQQDKGSNFQNNTFYAGQNTKFFDKRILASQKQNRPKNTFANNTAT
jgi:hypothetical protein